jgi:sec-independent protein translocase protein TatA
LNEVYSVSVRQAIVAVWVHQQTYLSIQRLKYLDKFLRRFFMALDGWEWIIIGVVAIVIIMWGPAKIPEFAKALGRAKGEFNKASKEFTDAATSTATTTTTTVMAPEPKPAQTIKTKDEMLLETAQKLGIPTDGKTREQISEEISVKVKLLGAEDKQLT